MARNLKYQFKTIIEKNFKEGMSKHSMKVDGSKSSQARIFSFADRKNLIDTSSNLANYMKDKYPEVKLLSEVKSEHIQSFFNDNAKGWTKSTIDVRMSHINKLEKLATQTYQNSKFDFTKDLIKVSGKDDSRTLSMSRDDYNKLLTSVKGGHCPSKSQYAVELSGRFALRVSETTKLQHKDIQKQEDGSYKLQIIDSKGGRSRTIEVTKEDDKAFLSQFSGNSTDRIVPYQSDSVNKFVNRHLDRCELREYIDAKTSVHSLRKMVAQEQYDACRASGLSRQESLDQVSEYLGHGHNRDELMERYISNIH